MKDGRKAIGVIGGMGPLATQLFYKMVIEKTDAHTDQEHINMVILNHATMPDRTDAILNDKLDDLMHRLDDDAAVLEKFGADYIVIPCNTCHVLMDHLQSVTHIPIINMIKETVKKIVSIHGKGARVGIMATDGTITWGLYQKECEANGLVPVIPNEDNQKLVMKIIYDGVKNGEPVDYADFEKIESQFREEQCDCVILACTELSCYKEEQNLPDYYVDAMEAMAEAAILLCDKELRSK
ncbi:MAG: amino acid racemase [Firmicutes bacterium]|nr:amino acid racemase [Bacillota bacterium]